MPISRVADIDIRLLRVFHTVHACGGLSAAELELNIGCSTISRHLSDLETRLGVILCKRGAGGFSLTEEGEHVLQASKKLFTAISVFQGELNRSNNQLTGDLKIALFDQTISNPKAKIHTALRLFDQQAPKVKLSITMEPANVIETGVLEGSFDIGVVPQYRNSTNLDIQEVYTEQMYLYLGSEHELANKNDEEITDEDICQSKYVGLGFNSPNLIAGNKLKLQASASAQDQEIIALMILSGRYVGFLPEHFAKTYCEQGKMRAICKQRFKYKSQFAAITRKSPIPGRKVAAFLRCLVMAHS